MNTVCITAGLLAQVPLKSVNASTNREASGQTQRACRYNISKQRRPRT